jgi:hypothetical protein
VGFIGGTHSKLSNYWLDQRLAAFFSTLWLENKKDSHRK